MCHTVNSVYKIIKYPLPLFHCRTEHCLFMVLTKMTEELDYANIRNGKYILN